MTTGAGLMIGLGVMIVKNGQVLLSQRQGKHGFGTWAFPGGHLEPGESVVDCAQREVREETGLEIRNVQPATFIEKTFPESGKHYLTLYVRAEWAAGEPQVMEPEKSGPWDWYDWERLPKPLFFPIQEIIDRGFRL